MCRRVLCAVFCLSIPSLVAGAASIATAAEADQQAGSQVVVRGRVLDSSGAAIVGAQVTVTSDRAGAPASAVTNQQGEFEIASSPAATPFA